MTALNSIKQSLLKGLRDTGLQAEALTSENAREVVKSREIKIILVSPEALKNKRVTEALLSERSAFVIKCVDEAHLFMEWGIQKRKKKSFRPAMKLSTGELSSLGKITLQSDKSSLSKFVNAQFICILESPPYKSSANDK